MRNITLVTFLLVVLLASPNVGATYLTGNALLEKCSGSSKVLLEGIPLMWCYGYIAAVVDMLQDLARMKVFNKDLCTASAPMKQLKRVVVKFLEEHPEKLHFSGTSLVFEALLEAFPCPEP